MRQLSEHLYAETEYLWANVGAAVTDAGIVLIDCPVRPSQSRHWQETLRPLSDRGIRYLIGTDYHPDHTTGIGFVEGDVEVIASRSLLEQLDKIRGDIQSKRKTFTDTLLDLGEADEAKLVADAEVPTPQICFVEHLTLNLAPLTFHIDHKGGHSPACSTVFVPEEGVLFSGDIMINEPGPGMRDASINQWIDALAWIETLPVEHVVPGHGDICTLREVRALKEQFIEIRGMMRDLIRAGHDKESASTDKSFEKYFWADTNRGPSWIESRRTTFRKGLEKLYEEAQTDLIN